MPLTLYYHPFFRLIPYFIDTSASCTFQCICNYSHSEFYTFCSAKNAVTCLSRMLSCSHSLTCKFIILYEVYNNLWLLNSDILRNITLRSVHLNACLTIPGSISVKNTGKFVFNVVHSILWYHVFQNWMKSWVSIQKFPCEICDLGFEGDFHSVLPFTLVINDIFAFWVFIISGFPLHKSLSFLIVAN